jgi:phage/plasmid-like protein (TIGR03299 family)
MNMTAMTTDVKFSTREVPWMKLGKLIDEPVTAREAAKLGGLDFTVSAHILGFNTGHLDDTNTWVYGEWQHIPNRRAIVRDDTLAPLGVMSDDYPILQYRDAFDFMDAISPHYVAAGALKGGRQGFMVVKAPEQGTFMKNLDPHDLYIVLRTSHDGTRAVEASVMPLRHRCMNQLTLRSFSKAASYRWSIVHTSSMHAKLKEAQDSLLKLSGYATEYEKLVNRMVAMKVSDDRARETLTFVLPDRPRRTEQIESIVHAWHNSPAVGFDYTGWGLVNAVSEYFEWGRAGGTSESRFINALQGSTHRTINQAVSYLLTT